MQGPLVSWLARLTPYGIAALLSWGFSTSGIIETLNLLLYDTGVQLRQQPSGQQTPIRLIGISENDIQRYGWPINDELLAKALERLDQAGSSAIGLDGSCEACMAWFNGAIAVEIKTDGAGSCLIQPFKSLR